LLTASPLLDRRFITERSAHIHTITVSRARRERIREKSATPHDAVGVS
jgi:hypothetical protein